LPLFRWRIVGLGSKPVEGANGIPVAVDLTVGHTGGLSRQRAVGELA
jgi:hypothetical protein